MPRQYEMLTILRQTLTNSQQARHKCTSGVWGRLSDELKHDQATGGSARTAAAFCCRSDGEAEPRGLLALFCFALWTRKIIKVLLFVPRSSHKRLSVLSMSSEHSNTC